MGLIGDYAFENANANMKEGGVVVNADVDYIGAMAFVTKTKRVAKNTIQPVSTTINQVVFTGNTPATAFAQLLLAGCTFQRVLPWRSRYGCMHTEDICEEIENGRLQDGVGRLRLGTRLPH